jgi:hypothetical protein
MDILWLLYVNYYYLLCVFGHNTLDLNFLCSCHAIRSTIVLWITLLVASLFFIVSGLVSILIAYNACVSNYIKIWTGFFKIKYSIVVDIHVHWVCTCKH